MLHQGDQVVAADGADHLIRLLLEAAGIIGWGAWNHADRFQQLISVSGCVEGVERRLSGLVPGLLVLDRHTNQCRSRGLLATDAATLVLEWGAG